MIQIMLIVCAAIITIIGGVLGILANKKKKVNIRHNNNMCGFNYFIYWNMSYNNNRGIKMSESKLEIKMVAISKEEVHTLIYPIIKKILKKHKRIIIKQFLKDLKSSFSKDFIYDKWVSILIDEI